MSFDWRILVDLAETLSREAGGASQPEGHQRTAVNRAYFGAFGHAFNYAVQFLGYDPKESPEDHGRLRDHLKTKKRKNAADRLRNLRQLRNEADYQNDLSWADVQQTVLLAIKQANEVFAILPPPTSAGT